MSGYREPRPKPLIIPQGYKWCPRCEVVLPHDEFRKSKSHSDGYNSWCKFCQDRQHKRRAQWNTQLKNQGLPIPTRDVNKSKAAYVYYGIHDSQGCGACSEGERCELFGLVKIGWSVNPKIRAHQWDILLIATEPGGQPRERDVHKMFKHLQVTGEFFVPANELVHYIQNLEQYTPENPYTVLVRDSLEMISEAS